MLKVVVNTQEIDDRLIIRADPNISDEQLLALII